MSNAIKREIVKIVCCGFKFSSFNVAVFFFFFFCFFVFCENDQITLVVFNAFLYHAVLES